MPRLLTGRRGRHDVPDLRCRCGIYAGDSLDVIDRERPAWPPPPVIGRAALWGRTIEHERGWRARFGYPDRLRLACAVCAWIEPGPGIPLVVHRFGGRLYALCEVHAGGIQLPDGRRTEPIGTEPRALQSRLLEAYAVDLLPAEPLEALFRRPPAPDVPAFFPAVRVLSRRPQA